VETFRCPTCIGVLGDPHARRCSSCGQNIRRRRPVVLGDDHRKGAYLPVDRWMLARLHAEGPRVRQHIAPVAWHGKFETSPLAEPDFSATPSPIATPLAPPSVPGPDTIAASVMVQEIDTRATEIDEAPPAVGPLELDAYTLPSSRTDDAVSASTDTIDAFVMPEPVFETAPVPDAILAPEAFTPAAYSPEPLPTPPSTPRPLPHEELDPEVRALVDDLYEQARQELSGNNGMAFFAPLDDRDDILEPERLIAQAARAASEPDPVIVDTLSPPLPPVAETSTATDPLAPPAPESRQQRGWQPAFVADDKRKRNLSE
jgi:hypothetical protein